jgi:hypothetical protein
MKFKIFSLLLILLFIACSEDNFLNIKSGNSTIQLDIQFSEYPVGFGKIEETVVISRVQVRVTGPGMDPIQDELSISGTTASGSIEVPKGSSRVFIVEGFDNNNILLFSGETTKDINNDVENVSIIASWLTTPLNITASVPEPYNEFSEVTNFVEVEFIGDGLRDPRYEALEIISRTPNATGTFQVHRGMKEIYILASLFAGPLEFELLDGYREINIGQTVPPMQMTLVPIDDQTLDFADHDGSFEETRFASTTGDIIATEFNINDYIMTPVFVKSIFYEQMIWEGNEGPFSIILIDGAGNIKFRSEVLPSQPNDGQSFWILLYNDPKSGIFENSIKAGFVYESDLTWPEIGFDTTDPDYSSWWFNSLDETWNLQSLGDFAITLIVQIPSGQEILLKSNKKSKSRMAEIKNNNLKIGKAYQEGHKK